MSEHIYDKKTNYVNILNRLQKKYSVYEGLLLMRRQYLTNNILYYFLCIIFRFIYLLSISGDYFSILTKGPSITFQSFLRKLNCHYLLTKLNFSFALYCLYDLIILILVIIKIVINIYNLKKFRKYKYTGKWPIPNKFQIIIGHFNFLFFPVIIEYLSFSYYIYFFPDKFLIQLKNSIEKSILIFIIFINTILIIIYNIDNYIWIYCSNKLFTVSIFEANLRGKRNNKISTNNHISYRCSNLDHYILIIFQNIILLSHLEEYINTMKIRILLLVVIALFLLLFISIFFINKINKFNYFNYINIFVNVLFLFCFNSVIFDFILFFIRYINSNILKEIIYVLIKIILGLIEYLLIVFKNHKFLETKICEILFQEKNNQNQKYFINSIYLLHQKMFLIKENNLIETAHSIFKLLNKHKNNCHKNSCGCKFFDIFEGKNININKTNNIHDSKIFLKQFLNILNYLYESAFVENNFYNNYDLTIILAEHFCHLRDNPTMSFSLISSLIIKNRNKFSIFEIANLYELNQKYVYFIESNSKKNIEDEINHNKIELLKLHMKEELVQSYYYNLILSNKIKAIINDYIDNMIKILKYKNIFDDSIIYQLDENNENIISAKIKFFEQNNQIENLYSSYSNKKSKNNKLNKIKIKINKKSNLYIIIYLLKKEQLYYREIIKSVGKIEISKNLPIVVVFKYFIFFDIFGGGKIPEEIVKPLFTCLDNNYTNVYNSIIAGNEYSILKKKYKEQNNKKGSKIYVIVDFKKELRTKYFTEDGSLKLGYKQMDIINEKIDILMPNEFCKSHQNSIKQLIIGSQIRHLLSKQSYFFYKGNSFLYSANFEGSLIYNISKTLIIMLESYFNYENEYRFMLNNNFDLMAISKNFEEEYYLNKKILESFDIHFLDIIKMKPEKFKKYFEKEYKKITYQKLVQQVKTNDYLIPELYVPPGDKIFSIVKSNNFNISKANVLSMILNKYKKEDENDYENIDNKNDYEEEKKRLIQKENITNSINEFFFSPREVVFHKTCNIVINKANFIENLYKELIKIPENDLKIENDKVFHNLLLSAKKLVSKLILKKGELTNHFIKISIKFSFYYDKPFYFITMLDEKKIYIKPCYNLNFENNDIKQISELIKNKIPNNSNSNSKLSRNKNIINNKISITKENKEIKDESNNKNNQNYHHNNFKNKKEIENKESINIINQNKKYINKAEFIKTIKFILSFIIIIIILIYIVIIIHQNSLIKKMQLILLSYYYNIFTKSLFLGIYSSLLNIYYQNFILGIPDYIKNYYVLTVLTNFLQEAYHNSTIYFYDSNSAIDHDFNLIFQKKKFIKLRGYWQEIEYESKYSSELDFIIYNILSFNPNELDVSKNIDFQNFLFFKSESIKKKVNGVYIKLLYYICANHEFVYKDLFKELENSIYDSYKIYVNKKTTNIIAAEIVGILLYIILFIIVFFYLYFSNNIIIKNIIFLFSDYNVENNDDKTNISNTNKIKLKLIEFQNLNNDFNLNLFEIFSKNMDNINRNKYIINSINKRNSKNSISTISDNLSIGPTSNSKGNSNKHNNLKEINLRNNSNKKLIDDINNKNNSNILSDIKSKKTNNSSQNNINESNSRFFKDSLNNNSINGSKEILSIKSNENIIINKNNFSKQNMNNHIIANNKNEDKLNMQDILLNNSNKSLVLMIKIYFIIIALLIILLIVFTSIKLNFIFVHNKKYNKYFSDMTVITDRYMQVYYYFNILRTLLIYPENERKKKFENILENMNSLYDEENNKFNSILTSNIKDYPTVYKLIQIFRESKNNSTNILKETICQESEGCISYLNSIYNIFDSGLELAFSSSISDIHNIFMDYKKLNNKTDIIGIKNIILLSNYKFTSIQLSLNFFYARAEQVILYAFKADEMNFNKSFIKNSTFLNIICIIFSILTFIFVIIFIFISISDFTEPIKDSTYRINCSFYYIKKYSLINYKKINSNLLNSN